MNQGTVSASLNLVSGAAVATNPSFFFTVDVDLKIKENWPFRILYCTVDINKPGARC